MTKTTTADAHKTDATPVTPLFGGAKVVVDETSKAVTPFGGLCSFIVYLQQIGFGARVAQAMPFPALTSPNGIPLAHTLTAFLFAVVTGASRFAHVDWLRGETGPCMRCSASRDSQATTRYATSSVGLPSAILRSFGGRYGRGYLP